MNDPTPPSRRYSEKEVGLILRRATELQRAEPSSPDPTGLTLAELQEIAAEAGIDPALLRDAAAEVQSFRRASLGTRLAGAPTKIVVERWVEGELQQERLEDLVPTIQAGTAGQGTASAVGRTLTWSSTSDDKMYAQQVLVSVRDGHTLVRVEEGLGGLSASLFGGIIGGVGGGVGFGVGGALSATLGLGAGLIAIPIAAVAGSYFLARAVFTAQARRRHAGALDLVNRLAEQVERTIPKSANVKGDPLCLE